MPKLALPCPFAMGHEIVSETAELGEGLDTDAPGKPLTVSDRVVAPCFWSWARSTGGRCS